MNLATRTFRRSDFVVTSPFGERVHPVTGKKTFHLGEDYGTRLENWDVFALEKGRVFASSQDRTNGNFIWVEYPRLGLRIFYCHLLMNNVVRGQWVDEDTVLGKVGRTGRATGIHLHMGVQRNRRYFNHADYEYVEEVKLADDLKAVDKAVIKVGDMVKMMGSVWATGERVPLWVRLKRYEVIKLNERSALLKGINSWARLVDLSKR